MSYFTAFYLHAYLRLTLVGLHETSDRRVSMRGSLTKPSPNAGTRERKRFRRTREGAEFGAGASAMPPAQVGAASGAVLRRGQGRHFPAHGNDSRVVMCVHCPLAPAENLLQPKVEIAWRLCFFCGSAMRLAFPYAFAKYTRKIKAQNIQIRNLV